MPAWRRCHHHAILGHAVLAKHQVIHAIDGERDMEERIAITFLQRE